MPDSFYHTPFSIGTCQFKHRLIQGPLAGFSAAPMRERFADFINPAYSVSEMMSALDVLNKHSQNSRYLYRSPKEGLLCYQVSGSDPKTLAKAALKLQAQGADLIDINCGCPKTKIRKKGAGSALLSLDSPLFDMIKAIKDSLNIPLTVKIRIQNDERDFELAQKIEDAGADALIVHGRTWQEDYDIPANLKRIGEIKKTLSIPVIANGDIKDLQTLNDAIIKTQCDAYMISRAGTGQPWLYADLLKKLSALPCNKMRIAEFMLHLKALEELESTYKAILQSKTLVRYYFKEQIQEAFLKAYYALDDLKAIEDFLQKTVLSA